MFNQPSATQDNSILSAKEWNFRGLTIRAVQVKDGNGLWDLSANYGGILFNLVGGFTPEQVQEELENAGMDSIIWGENLPNRSGMDKDEASELVEFLRANPPYNNGLEEMPDGIGEPETFADMEF